MSIDDLHLRLQGPAIPKSTDGNRLITKVLIANRGEIACRVIRTCRLLGIATVAIYVLEDAASSHVTEADESVCMGSINAQKVNPYLDAQAIIKVAVEAGADAIHPGYGYLSEQAEFADLVRRSGVIFIGPRDKALSTLGDKRQAKEHLATHEPSVPLVPGYAGKDDNNDALLAAAARIGYPVMIKASAGGGGKGMKIAYESSELLEAVARARSEAKRSFGNSDCILEKYVAGAKHVEMQIIGDQHGTIVCLLERDCSIQRRHQKIIEESPCSWLPADLRDSMRLSAIRIGELLQYEGAGTVEFLLDVETQKYYFLEVNARLQVEHPITEEVTGVDLVALQLFIAAGGQLASLPYLRDVRQRGHAIECRLCAEEPRKDFAPQHGTIEKWLPAGNISADIVVRYETAVSSGSQVSIYFDSMIAKIVVWAPNRSQAIEVTTRLLRHTHCVGVKTNQLFLQSCLLHPAFRNPAYTTAFIPANMETLLRNPYLSPGSKVLKWNQILPALLLEISSASRPPQSAFHNVRSKYRNLKSDSWRWSTSIVTDLGSELDTTSPILATRFSRDESTNELKHAEYRKLDGSSDSAVTQFSALSNDVRKIHPETWQTTSISNVKISSKGEERFIHANIGGTNFSMSMTMRPVREDGEQRILFHIPHLGTWTEFRCESLLKYFSRISSEAANNDASKASSRRVHIATMPGKVLALFKTTGEKIKAGDAILLMESMKMETRICTAEDGEIEVMVQAGDSVEEGQVLCRVHQEAK
ncbi:Methylcrotonoyl-CoA carboxylase subunit alpha, mitochondrial [Pseudocercospora fuligena]|uniref:Methylcrotonoyl-CoA carboxylase subunit alpha, mitochondrial n=1 Tax=Pseudocercospora fuligena TaxID=685502 RepID=A0A8H6R3I1_9PEZI|nr:Methylcrotonoyl-CoA carboxylase subunit alpha, mitochondrial [Pseudocercospora fuligena]